MIEITIHQTSPGRYAATLNDRLLVQHSRTPLLESARVLLAEGADPETVLGMRRATGPIAMSGPLGALAKLAVREGAEESPRFVPHRPFDAEMPIASAPVARQRLPFAKSSARSPEPSRPS